MSSGHRHLMTSVDPEYVNESRHRDPGMHREREQTCPARALHALDHFAQV